MSRTHGRPPPGWARALRAAEPLLVLLAAPPLLLVEGLGPLAALGGAAWIGALWWARRRVEHRWTLPLVIDAPTLALLATVPAAVWVAQDATAAVSRAASLLFAVAVAYAVANGVPTTRAAWRAAGALLAASTALALGGAVATDFPVKLAALAPAVAAVPRWVPSVPHAVFGRVPGTAPAGAHPNMLAALLLPGLVLAAACLFWPGARRAGGAAPDPRGAPRALRALAWLALASGGPVLVLTQSRGAWLALGITAALATSAARRPRGASAPSERAARRARVASPVVLAGAAAGAMLALALADDPRTLGGLDALGGAELDAAGRMRLWSAVLDLVRASPLTGIGLHQFALRFGQDPTWDGFVYHGLAHAHNVLLQAALDYGVPGLVAVVGLAAALVVATLRARRHTTGTPLDPLVAGLAFGLLAHGLHGLVDAVAVGAKPGALVWAQVGLLAAARARARRWVAEVDDAAA